MAQKVYGKMGPSSYSEIAQDFHRMRWNPGDWTDDTDQMLLILQMIVENDGKVDRVDFAKRLYHWMQHGYEELGDIGGMGIGMTVHRTLCHNLFLKDPHAAAKHVWENSGRYLAANGAIMRTSILGILNFNGELCQEHCIVTSWHILAPCKNTSADDVSSSVVSAFG